MYRIEENLCSLSSQYINCYYHLVPNKEYHLPHGFWYLELNSSNEHISKNSSLDSKAIMIDKIETK